MRRGFERVLDIMINELSTKADKLMTRYQSLSEGNSFRDIIKSKNVDINKFKRMIQMIVLKNLTEDGEGFAYQEKQMIDSMIFLSLR